jgi:ubiquinone/menaquinone biosynthesis C-methylase UbiE
MPFAMRPSVIALVLAWIAPARLVSAMSSSASSQPSVPSAATAAAAPPTLPVVSFDKSAQAYSDNFTRFSVLYAADLIRASMRQMGHAKTILEVGCGAGAFGLAYLSCFPTGVEGQTVICTDLSLPMVSKAEEVIKAKLPPAYLTRFVFQVADGTSLEGILDDSCDVVASVFGIFLIPDRAAALGQARRVLKKDGGLLATTAWTTTEHNRELQDAGFGANLHDAMGLLKVLPAGTPLEGRMPQPLPPLVRDWFDRDKIREMLNENGLFHSVQVHRSVHSVVFGSVEDMWTVFGASSPHVAAELADQDPVQVGYTRQAFGRWVAPDGNEGGPLFIQAAANLVLAT